ncbi:MAG: porin family protein [Acidobacteriales bacterium]|nr:porin family protein [Terriglobales bacterium]
MKSYWYVPTVLLGIAAVAAAQESAPTPVVEVGLNYSLTNFHPGNGVSGFTANGGGGSFLYNVNKVFGVEADLGGYHNGSVDNLDTTTFSYLFGPRLSWRHSRSWRGLSTRIGSRWRPRSSGAPLRVALEERIS